MSHPLVAWLLIALPELGSAQSRVPVETLISVFLAYMAAGVLCNRIPYLRSTWTPGTLMLFGSAVIQLKLTGAALSLATQGAIAASLAILYLGRNSPRLVIKHQRTSCCLHICPDA